MGFGGDDGPPTDARIKASGIATDDSGYLIIADTGNDRIRQVSLGTIRTIAGNGADGYTGDEGRPLDASFGAPYGVTVADGNVYVTDTSNHVVRRIDPQGFIHAVA